MLQAALGANQSDEVARLARALKAVPRVLAGAVGLTLAEDEGAEEVDSTDAAGGISVVWRGPVSSLFGGATAVEEITIPGIAEVFLRNVGEVSEIDARAAAAIMALLVLRARGTLANAADDTRLDLGAFEVAWPAGQDRDGVALAIPLTLTIRLQIGAPPEDAVLTTPRPRIVYPYDLREGD